MDSYSFVRWVVPLCVLSALLDGCATNQQKETPPQIERISAEELERLLPKPAPNLTYDDLVRLSREGAAPDAIIEKIKLSNSSYELTPSQTIDLSRQGVDAKVLDYIHSTRELTLREGCADELNKRDHDHKVEVDTLQRQLLLRTYPMYDPFWGPYPPYWRYPYYRRR